MRALKMVQPEHVQNHKVIDSVFKLRGFIETARESLPHQDAVGEPCGGHHADRLKPAAMVTKPACTGSVVARVACANSIFYQAGLLYHDGGNADREEHGMSGSRLVYTTDPDDEPEE
ncbi:MAG: hypothetical protein RLZZ387_1414, partial [Chloroflexota bacterium]